MTKIIYAINKKKEIFDVLIRYHLYGFIFSLSPSLFAFTTSVSENNKERNIDTYIYIEKSQAPDAYLFEHFGYAWNNSSFYRIIFDRFVFTFARGQSIDSKKIERECVVY